MAAVFLAGVLAAGCPVMAANPFLQKLFTNHMVLQRDVADPVWGWAPVGTTVTVVVKDPSNTAIQTTTAVADSTGRWQATVGPFGLVPGNAAYSMVISAPGQTTSTLTDILIGDVYLGAGQSNMFYSLNTINVINLSAEIADANNYPKVRIFAVPGTVAATPQVTYPQGAWLAASSSTVGNLSAAAYFTAREIFKQQGVPVGFITAAYGGTSIEAWLDAANVSSVSDFIQPLYDQVGQALTSASLTGLYYGMITPLFPYRIKGVEWYQGENNVGKPEQYSRLLPRLMSLYRTGFGQPSLPFVIIQLPNLNAVQTAPVETGSWAELREAQKNTSYADGNARLVTTIDLGGVIPFNANQAELHPKDKQDVGLRAARAAANLFYGQNVVNQGPFFFAGNVSGSTITCTFLNTGAGLMVGSKNYQTPLSGTQQVVGGTLKGFAIAGSNRVFVAANATISGNTVIVSSPSVTSPLYVRYAWGNNPQGNLYNKITDAGGNVVDGLPAGSFRNDPVYRLTVNGGTGSTTTQVNGTVVAITAATNAGESFHHWSGDANFLANANAASTTATLSHPYTTVLANYTITGAPAGLVASPTSASITLTWTALNGAHYKILRSTSASGPFTQLVTDVVAPTYVDTAVVAGTQYYYTVTAFNPQGAGPASGAVHNAPGA